MHRIVKEPVHTGTGYRTDLDALRAIAALIVIGFHWHVPPFTGGFVGVDVFFVISGFFITGLLIREIDRKTVTLIKFYERRSRRVIPALYAAILGTLAIFWFLQVAPDYRQLGLSAASAITFSSNVLFWSQSGYFDAPSLDKPLLHTWSLAVEEQFYLILAPALWVFTIGTRRSTDRRRLLVGVAVLALGSFTACLWLLKEDQSAAYYFGVSRAWEFLLGALLAAWDVPPPPTALAKFATLLFGTLLIMGAAVCLTEASLFPGVSALVPCAGAALIIWGGAAAHAFQRSPLTRALASVGRISYPMYLWHWPLYVAAITAFDGLHKMPVAVRLALLILTLMISWASYKFIETPIRRRVVFPTARGFGLALGVASLLLLAFAIAIWCLDGLPDRTRTGRIASYLKYEHKSLWRQRKCFLEPKQTAADYDKARCYSSVSDKKNVLLFGDSLAAHYYVAFAEALPRMNVMQATAAACPPFDAKNGTDKYCSPFANAVFDLVREQPPFAIILSGNWPYMANAFGHKRFLERIREAIDIFTGLGIRVAVMGPSPQYTEAVPRIIIGGSGDTLTASPGADVFELDREMATALRDIPLVSFLSVLDVMCEQETCRLLAKPTVPMQWDRLHFTTEGARLVIDRLRPKIADLFGESR